MQSGWSGLNTYLYVLDPCASLAPAPLPHIPGRVHWKMWLKQLLSSGESSTLPCLKVSSTYFLYCDCKGHHTQYSQLIWDLFLTHFYADFTILILRSECIFFFSFLLCVTAIKNINLLGIFTVQIQCLLAHFLFLWLLQHRIWGPSVVGSFVPLLHSPAWFMLEVLNAHTTWLSQSATAFLPGEPWKTPTCTPQTTSNTNQPDTWLVLHHIPGALGCQSLEQACPLLLQASPTYNGYLSTLPGRRHADM